MEGFLKGKTAVVTGATRGIGRAVAERLLKEGARVAFCARSPAAVERTQSELMAHFGRGVIGAPADVSDPSQVQQFFRFVDERFGGLDALVNNAGIGIFQPVGEMDVESWKRTVDTNLTGVFLCSREAVLRMRNRGGGFVINIGSLAGRNAFAGGAAYNASKFGVVGFTEAMMLDHRHDDIRVCCIMPGSVATDFQPGSQPDDWKIAPEDIADIVIDVLRLPARTLISRVEVRPSKPQR